MKLVNFMAWRERRQRRHLQGLTAVASSLCLAVLVSITLLNQQYRAQWVDLQRQQAIDLALTQAVQQKIAGQEGWKQHWAQQQAELSQRHHVAQALQQWSEIWVLLATTLPERMWLTRAELTPPQWRLVGQGLDVADLAIFRGALATQPALNDVQLQSLTQQHGEHQFILQFTLAWAQGGNDD